ncbi:hypothetical protein GGX14DRAFT_557380 [Mycena pura]|uniref:Uncharacterized protein n=1 Tax=Mycena pura TaxID=153505 RepID=A0AAD6YNG9_9AGAR|nr:hypothetical protein GGX14DRAFT_557380 [Mycena pura]
MLRSDVKIIPSRRLSRAHETITARLVLQYSWPCVSHHSCSPTAVLAAVTAVLPAAAAFLVATTVLVAAAPPCSLPLADSTNIHVLSVLRGPRYHHAMRLPPCRPVHVSLPPLRACVPPPSPRSPTLAHSHGRHHSLCPSEGSPLRTAHVTAQYAHVAAPYAHAAAPVRARRLPPSSRAYGRPDQNAALDGAVRTVRPCAIVHECGVHTAVHPICVYMPTEHVERAHLHQDGSSLHVAFRAHTKLSPPAWFFNTRGPACRIILAPPPLCSPLSPLCSPLPPPSLSPPLCWLPPPRPAHCRSQIAQISMCCRCSAAPLPPRHAPAAVQASARIAAASAHGRHHSLCPSEGSPLRTAHVTAQYAHVAAPYAHAAAPVRARRLPPSSRAYGRPDQNAALDGAVRTVRPCAIVHECGVHTAVHPICVYMPTEHVERAHLHQDGARSLASARLYIMYTTYQMIIVVALLIQSR